MYGQDVQMSTECQPKVPAMKLTIDVAAILAKIQARRAREAELRRRGLVIFRDWWTRRQQKKGRIR